MDKIHGMRGIDDIRYKNIDPVFLTLIKKLENYSKKYSIDTHFELYSKTNKYIDSMFRNTLIDTINLIPINKTNLFKQKTAELAKIGEEFINYFENLLTQNLNALQIAQNYHDESNKRINNFVQSVQPQKGGKRRSRKTRRRSTKKSVGGKRRKSRASKRSKRRKSRK
jgi:hypothetical protein